MDFTVGRLVTCMLSGSNDYFDCSLSFSLRLSSSSCENLDGCVNDLGLLWPPDRNHGIVSLGSSLGCNQSPALPPDAFRCWSSTAWNMASSISISILYPAGSMKGFGPPCFSFAYFSCMRYIPGCDPSGTSHGSERITLNPRVCPGVRCFLLRCGDR